MSCLNDIEVQAIVDGEASEANRAHVAGCARCRDRVEVRRRDMAAMTAAASAGDLSPAFAARMQRAIDEGRPARGSTTLRTALPRASHRRAWLSAAAAVAAAVIVTFLVLPKIGAPTSLSAAEVLGRSLQTMTGVKGVELLEYDLSITGGMAGSDHIVHLIDHDRPGRYRFSNYGPDGALEATVGQDPATGRRFLLARADGRGVMVNIEPGTSSQLSLPEMMQAVIETAITMMQANRDQTLTVHDTPAGRQYVIEMPPVQTKSSAAVLDLYSARAVIDAGDFRIQEFSSSGAVLRQPYAMSFKLIRRTIRPSAEVPAEEFAAPVNAGDVVIDASAGSDPLTDVLSAFVREISKRR